MDNDALYDLQVKFQLAFKEKEAEMTKLVQECDHDTKLAITAWVFQHIVDHALQGGSYRTLIYDRLGFGPEAYAPLYSAGGMTISNEFDIERMDLIKAKVREEKIEALKPILNMCDEPDCYKDAGCGFPTENGYRHTCYDHSKFKKESTGE